MHAPSPTLSRRSFIHLGLTAACIPITGPALAAAGSSAQPWTLSGRLIDATGLPVRHAWVSAGPSIDGRTDCDGRFFVVGTGPLERVVDASGAVRLEVTLANGARSLRLRMPVERPPGGGRPLLVVQDGYTVA